LAYVNQLMASVVGLHGDIVSEIRNQVQGQLHERVSHDLSNKLNTIDTVNSTTIVKVLQGIFQDPSLK